MRAIFSQALSSAPDPALGEHLRREGAAHPALTPELAALLVELAAAGRLVAGEAARAPLTGRLGDTGAVNVQGERVKKLDEWANRTLVETLRESRLVSVLVSEELEEPLLVPECRGPSRYVVCLDPVDGSLNADVNGVVGTIFGVRPGLPAAGPDPGAAALGPGTAQVAAGYLMYGPATVLVYTAGHGVHGLTLDPVSGEFVLTHPAIRMPPEGTTYAVNEANRRHWPPAARDCVETLKGGGATGRPHSLRYVGALVADFHRILLEGGVYLYPAEPLRRPTGRLRLLYEAAPLALVAEQAGGRASTGTARVLEVAATAFHQRVPLLIGSPREVALAEACYRGEAAHPNRDA